MLTVSARRVRRRGCGWSHGVEEAGETKVSKQILHVHMAYDIDIHGENENMAYTQ